MRQATKQSRKTAKRKADQAVRRRQAEEDQKRWLASPEGIKAKRERDAKFWAAMESAL